MRIIGVVCLLCCCLAQSQEYITIVHSEPVPTKNACGEVLSACQNLVDAQDASITKLRAYARQLEDKVEKDEAPPLVPTWLLIALGVAGGAVLGYSIHK